MVWEEEPVVPGQPFPVRFTLKVGVAHVCGIVFEGVGIGRTCFSEDMEGGIYVQREFDNFQVFSFLLDSALDVSSHDP